MGYIRDPSNKMHVVSKFPSWPFQQQACRLYGFHSWPLQKQVCRLYGFHTWPFHGSRFAGLTTCHAGLHECYVTANLQVNTCATELGVTVRLSVTSHLLTLSDMRTCMLCLTHTNTHTSVHYIILHYITLHWITLPDTILYYFHYITLHFSSLHALNHSFIHTYIHIYTHTYIHTYIHTHTYIHAYIHTYNTYIHTIHTYIHTHIHKHIYTHTHTHSPSLCLSLSLFNVLEQGSPTVCPRAFWCSPERCSAHENFKISRMRS